MPSGQISRRQFLQASAYGGMAVALGRSPLRPLSRVPALTTALAPTPREILWAADPSISSVYLTIDDWFDREMVEAALDIARRQRVGLTFFPIGRLVAGNADLVRRAAREGHELENHTWDHQRLDLGHCPIAKIPGEIEKQFVALRKVLGPTYRQRFLRPPGGFGIIGGVNPHLVEAAEQAGLRIAMWSVDSQGWRAGQRSDPDAVEWALWHVAPGLAGGAVVLEHAIPDDILALETEIVLAKERGLKAITMAEGIPDAPPQPTPSTGPAHAPAPRPPELPGY